MMSRITVIALLCLSVLVALDAKPARDKNNKDYRLVCYLGSWANYRPGSGKFVIEDIDYHLCTHLIYGFTKLENDRIAVFDPYLDVPENYGLGAYNRFNRLRLKNPNLTTIIAIGGWNEGSEKYSTMARDPNRRRVFVDSVLNFLHTYGFDGLDFDWEYPAARDGKPDDKQYFVQVLKDLKEAFTPHGYLLTAAVSPGKPTIENAYDIPQVAKYLDFINLMTYDYHGAWDTFTGINAPLSSRPSETGEQLYLNADFSVNFWISQGAPADKIVMGMPLYGRCLTLADPSRNGLGDPVIGPGHAGPYTREPGTLGYNEICSQQIAEKGQWKIVWDDHHKAPYMTKGDQWCGYDDPKSLEFKVDYLKSKHLGGAMVWSIDTDDFKGHCSGISYPLLRTIYAKLQGSPWVIPTQSPVIVTDPQSSCTAEGNFGYPNECQRYFQCINQQGVFKAVDRNCAPGTSFDAVQRQCLHDSVVKVCGQDTNPVKPTPPVVKPTSPTGIEVHCTATGIFAHPGDCTKFYRCAPSKDGFTATESPCPGGLVFNPRSSVCDYKQNVPECQ